MKYLTIDPSEVLDPALRADLLDTWVAVTDAGGAVGFTPPAQVPLVAATLDAALRRVADGTDALGVLHHGDRYVGMGLLVDRGSALSSHWRTVLRVMVHPRHQGGGTGTTLMTGLRDTAVDLGLEQLQLTVRAGHGLENFYQRLGYRVVGRHPRAVRVAAADYRDEVMMVTDLTAAHHP